VAGGDKPDEAQPQRGAGLNIAAADKQADKQAESSAQKPPAAMTRTPREPSATDIAEIDQTQLPLGLAYRISLPSQSSLPSQLPQLADQDVADQIAKKSQADNRRGDGTKFDASGQPAGSVGSAGSAGSGGNAGGAAKDQIASDSSRTLGAALPAEAKPSGAKASDEGKTLSLGVGSPGGPIAVQTPQSQSANQQGANQVQLNAAPQPTTPVPGAVAANEANKNSVSEDAAAMANDPAKASKGAPAAASQQGGAGGRGLAKPADSAADNSQPVPSMAKTGSAEFGRRAIPDKSKETVNPKSGEIEPGVTGGPEARLPGQQEAKKTAPTLQRALFVFRIIDAPRSVAGAAGQTGNAAGNSNAAKAEAQTSQPPANAAAAPPNAAAPPANPIVPAPAGK
jgi:hypothetical protein